MCHGRMGNNKYVKANAKNIAQSSGHSLFFTDIPPGAQFSHIIADISSKCKQISLAKRTDMGYTL